MERIAVLVRATDPISQAGVIAQLRTSDQTTVVSEADARTVHLIVIDEMDPAAVHLIRTAAQQGNARTVLVATRVDDAGLLKAVEAGVVAIVRRCEATTESLLSAIRSAARGEGAVPADLLGRLLGQVGRLQRQVLNPRGLTVTGFAQRELDVLRLVADGLDTSEIARELCYSERTVKNVLHGVTQRLSLRNRSQAVAYAIREGLI